MTQHVTVSLSGGKVRGVRHDEHLSFMAIPYAAPPSGDRRWRAPVTVEPWEGVRDATEPGRPAPQLARSFADVTSLDEDCLTVDVTVPAAERTENTPRPVVVWLHGGGGTNGSPSECDPHRLAITGDVIVVAPRFRLGVFGCFGYPGLPGSGTFGLQDQQAALRWVRDEIARFGGDPGNVTLMGESYGAQTVAAHLCAPASKDLFHRAIVQSAFALLGPTPANTLIPGVPALPPRWTPVAELERFGAEAAVANGWVSSSADPMSAMAALRKVPSEELLAGSGDFIRPAFGDGGVLPRDPAAVMREGNFHRVPVLLGTTRDEARFFVGLFADLAGNPVTAERYPRLLAEAFGEHADEVAARYPLTDYPSPSLAMAQVSTDRAWARPAWELALALAAHTRTWFYEFADTGAPALLPLPGFPSGAQHGSELGYQFDLAGGGPALSAEQRELGEAMNRYWAAFAANGDPATPGLPVWPESGTGHVQSLAPRAIGGTDYVARHQLGFWEHLP
ncbi:para-nitrobenzyl esterase [Prauserella marina]|uniref:Para-nitrobenzyl esterase n=1 Tax=Prauserella marina TaxID=530584 RepID=A0A222VS67_9PSEU|nr:carboxylesterase family protein [Prauserella marina]ASR36749.1 para-nitrobenzyl esterase [Prauserella marina]PWV80362.1 carboxylesterase type B [Prauserella marina]SDD52659.1 para-nitrobenzyl esterase [Prauserella marina]